MNKKEKIEFDKQRKLVIKELEKVEKKVGTLLFRSAVSRKMRIDTQKRQREKEINQLQKELQQLQKGKPIGY